MSLEDNLEEAVRDTMNWWRTQSPQALPGLKPYDRDPGLNQSARNHSKALIEHMSKNSACQTPLIVNGVTLRPLLVHNPPRRCLATNYNPHEYCCPAKSSSHFNWDAGHWCDNEEAPEVRIAKAVWSTHPWPAPLNQYVSENVGCGYVDNPVEGAYKSAIGNIHGGFMQEGLGGGHHDAIMSPSFQQVGIGVHIDPQQPLFFVFTVDFAKTH